ncbi:phage head closure protein [Alkalilacustris brevis]|uniref:phage head closure protein n=1 Tax=Alkalilacustris brevis TaxID=2026338 RepID=UPI000E0DE409|nr:phage head closure protein [Alkalilacustris brevis]
MRSGRLRHKITVQRATETVDAAGTPSFDWAELATLRAEVVQQSTEEFIRSQGASDERVVIFRTRFLAGVGNDDRIVWRGEAHNIREVAVLGHEHGLEIRTVTHEGAE